MKNIQIIEPAQNCTYDIFSIDDESFNLIFPNNQDIEFNDDLFQRLSETVALDLSNLLWKNRVSKKDVQGIDGTLFYDMPEKKQFYPTEKDNEAIRSF
ncbi:hypothetical protein [Kiloniella sp. EL199]|uniref:hypothetical protein n=1 Tax=Kiloniella sp. EL199 TaxID=2107581 RepID=UPI000EA2A35C|nr:hypothetical protein [Kiloniella sp. EL199]